MPHRLTRVRFVPEQGDVEHATRELDKPISEGASPHVSPISYLEREPTATSTFSPDRHARAGGLNLHARSIVDFEM